MVLPAVTAAPVMLMVEGAQTGVGFVITRFGLAFIIKDPETVACEQGPVVLIV
jgi:hypothetical protein